MRLLAGLLLALVTLLFLLSWHYRALHPALPYVQAFCEAAMIGGLADWFAIVALFRRPLGLPIPHTAIIPANKARIGRSLGDFLVTFLLDGPSLAALLRDLALPAHGGNWLRQRHNAELLADWIVPAVRDLWQRLDGGSRLSAIAADLPIASLLAGAAARAAASGSHDRLMAAMLDSAANFLAANREDFRDQLGHHSPRWVPSWLDGKLSDLLCDMAIGLLADLASPEHRWRRQLDHSIVAFPERLRQREDWQQQIRALQVGLLSDPDLQQDIAALLAVSAERHGLDRSRLADLLVRFGERLVVDRDWHHLLQGWIETLAAQALLPRRHAISAFVADLVAGWNDADLVARLETEVGADLHYIRLNGTLVGGLVGLALFGMTQWLS